MEWITYSINKLEKEIIKSKLQLEEGKIELEEYYLFSDKRYPPARKKYVYSLSANKLQKLLLREVCKIKHIEKAPTSTIKGLLSSYGSFYYGGDTFYYSDDLMKFNNEQVFQILCNHIFHYMYGFHIYNKDISSIMSAILLGFSHAGLTDEKIKYALSDRNDLFKKDRYQKVRNQFIIFPPNNNSHYSKFLINQNMDHDFFYKYIYKGENGDYEMIMGTEMNISEGYTGFPIFNYMIFNGKIKKTNVNINEFEKIIKSTFSMENNAIIDKQIEQQYLIFKQKFDKEVYNNEKDNGFYHIRG